MTRPSISTRPADTIIRNRPGVPQKAAPLLHRPRVVDRRCDRVEHAERGPDQRDDAPEAEGDRLGLERIELTGDEIELAREIAKNESHDRVPLGGVGRQLAEDGQRQQKNGKSDSNA